MSLKRFRDDEFVPPRPNKKRQIVRHVGDDEVSQVASSRALVQSSRQLLTPASQADTAVELCDEQKGLVDLIASGENVFYTGAAGCGKSTVLRAFVAILRSLGKRVSITAPTGRAALDIGGCTTWTFAGWTPDSMKKPLSELELKVQGRHIRTRLQNVDVLVIDEISAVENHFFERLNRIMKIARGNRQAFGGVQIVVAGDFRQLPPVKPFRCCMECGHETRIIIEGTTYRCLEHGRFSDADKWAFVSGAWVEAEFRNVYLRDVHRQTDPQLISILETVRLGNALNEEQRSLLENHACDVRGAVILCAKKEKARSLNAHKFGRLQGRGYTYRCLDKWKWNPAHEEIKYKGKRSTDGSLIGSQDHPFDDYLELKEGMRVVLLRNLDIPNGLVNGAQGKIVAFQEHRAAELPRPKWRFEDDYIRTDDRQERLATQQAPSLGGDHVALRQEEAKKFMEDYRNEDKYWPIVQFDNGRRVPVHALYSVSSIGDEEPYSLLARTQIPLTAAWAMTIHKSQGMTLDKVIVDVSDMFEDGQLYVALSRAKSLSGLKVQGFESGYEGGRGNPEVRDFYRRTFGIEE